MPFHIRRFPLLSACLLLFPALSWAQSLIPCAGQYKSFKDYQQHKVGRCTSKLQYNPDSSYTFSSEDWQLNHYDANVWGIIDSNGTQYIRVWYATFLPLHQRGDTCYVYIPSNLLDNYLADRRYTYEIHTASYLGLGAMPLLLLVCTNAILQGVLSGPGFTWAVVGATALMISFDLPIGVARWIHHHRMIKKQKVAENFHYFSIDMHTGEIQYYKPLKS